MSKFKLYSFVLICFTAAHAQNKTDVSLFNKNNLSTPLREVISTSGDMFNVLAHHGPAIENEFLGFRLYFDYKAAIDVYSKANKRLELSETKWYPTVEQQTNGWGADYYKVGETIGLGSIRLWDGNQVVNLNPVSERTARVVKEANVAFIEMLSKDIPYKESKVDVLVRITVYSGTREAKVEAFALSDMEVQFVTGINYFENQQTIWNDSYLLTWGKHPEDVASASVSLGAAVIFDPEDYLDNIDDGKQKLLISKQTKTIEHVITSSNSRESRLSSFPAFKNYVERILPN